MGEALVEAKGVRMITLSGSTAEGRRVGVLAGKHLERVALELGGKTNFVSVEVSASRVPGVRVKQRWVLVHGALPRGVRVPPRRHALHSIRQFLVQQASHRRPLSVP